jgi:cell division protein FtsB
MSRTEKTPLLRRRWLLWLVPIALCLVAFQAMTGPRGLMKVADLRAQKAAILREIDSLETRKKELLVEKNRLLTDTAYLEKIARKELGMIRPGEKVYRFVAPASEESEHGDSVRTR